MRYDFATAEQFPGAFFGGTLYDGRQRIVCIQPCTFGVQDGPCDAAVFWNAPEIALEAVVAHEGFFLSLVLAYSGHCSQYTHTLIIFSHFFKRAVQAVIAHDGSFLSLVSTDSG